MVFTGVKYSINYYRIVFPHYFGTFEIDLPNTVTKGLSSPDDYSMGFVWRNMPDTG
jgi:hypothetical protein